MAVGGVADPPALRGAAFNVLDGKVIGECLPWRRRQEFLKFLRKIDRETPPALELHLIRDNYSTHKPEQVKKRLAARGESRAVINRECAA